MTHIPFELDPRLETSSLWIQDLPLCQLRLKNDRRFPWVVLIPRRPNIIEIFDLEPNDQHQLWSEVTSVTRYMQNHFQAYKMNVETLGNMVRQLHIHIIARYENDAAWPNSVLNFGKSEPYLPDEMDKRSQELSNIPLT